VAAIQVLPVPAEPEHDHLRACAAHFEIVGLRRAQRRNRRLARASVSNVEACSSMISAVPDERVFRRRFLLTCLLKDRLLLLGWRGMHRIVIGRIGVCRIGVCRIGVYLAPRSPRRWSQGFRRWRTGFGGDEHERRRPTIR